MRRSSAPVPFYLRGPLAGVSLRVADLAKRAALSNYGLFLRAAGTPPEMLDALSPFAALRAAAQARERVPAYQDFLAKSGWRDDPSLPPLEQLARLPLTDKPDYIKAYSTEQRCLDGRIPMAGTEIDESSGSSGTPYNWVRSAEELEELHAELAQFARYYCGRNVITINGFSMGAWATGVNVGEALLAIGIVKSTGPDVDKILHTLEFFGPKYPYVITGYPPFLKHLLDEGEARGFDWSAYKMVGLVGGEGMSEGLRTYLLTRFRAVYSGYGASDLDMGVAGESADTIFIRRHADTNPQLRRALFGDDPRLPMLFHYNPLDYFIETNDEGELIITINRLSVLSPRIRYNIHDAGGVIPYKRMLAILREFGLDPVKASERPGKPIFQLPYLYLFGRSDSTVSYMGANIYPEDIEHALYADPADAHFLKAYCMELVEVGSGGEVRPCIHVEVFAAQAEDTALRDRLRTRVVDHLLECNLDFRSAVSEDATAADIGVRLYPPGGGPFTANSGRIKRRYIIPRASGTPPTPAGTPA